MPGEHGQVGCGAELKERPLLCSLSRGHSAHLAETIQEYWGRAQPQVTVEKDRVAGVPMVTQSQSRDTLGNLSWLSWLGWKGRQRGRGGGERSLCILNSHLISPHTHMGCLSPLHTHSLSESAVQSHQAGPALLVLPTRAAIILAICPQVSSLLLYKDKA